MKNEYFLIIILIIIIQGNIFSQNVFVEMFPEYNFNDLPEDIRTLKKVKSADIDIANQFMWADHASIRKQTIGYSYLRKAPHYMLEDGSFDKGVQGMFSRETKNRNGKIILSSLYPLAKIKIVENITMLLIYYRTWSPEDEDWLEFYEAYTYRLSDEKLLSAICLWTNKKFCISFKKKDNTFELFEELYYTTDGESESKSSISKIIYKIRDDGYFQQVINTDIEQLGIGFWATINDKDGYSNVREKPQINSSILYTIKDEGIVFLEKTEFSNWYRVICHVKDDKTEHHGGYIHESRIRK